jgi:FADH2 O2-dependent halogenase
MAARHFDIAVIGSGFGGSLLAMVACRLGLSVLLLERGKHPRFAVGESTSPLTNLLIEELSLRYDLPRLLPLTSYGPWQHTYPDIGCGLKRGFTYYHHVANTPFSERICRDQQLLVAASPSDEVADTHWLRSDVDAFLKDEAVSAGAEYREQVDMDAPEWHPDGTATIRGTTRSTGSRFTETVRLVVDATGPRGFLSRTLDLPSSPFPNYPATHALFSHFKGVKRCEGMSYFADPEIPPYAVDDAALHHVFDGGWMWVLRFRNGITSAGFAVTDEIADELHLAEGPMAWSRFLARFPVVGEQFAEAEAILPFVHIPRLTYRSTTVTGPGWVMLPSASAFIDPLFSTGIPLTLLGIQRLGRILAESWGTDDLPDRLAGYGRLTLAEVDATADFVSGCYAGMRHFRLFTALSMFYFAAASYSEIARRLGKHHLVTRYLATDHPEFGVAMRECANWVRRHGNVATDEEIACFERRVSEGIACLNIAGLHDSAKRNWYGVDLNDLVVNAGKVGITADEMRHVVATAPWARS